MLFKQPRGKPEKEGRERLFKVMRNDGWSCHRLNVSAGSFSTVGFPDAYCINYNVPVKLTTYNPNYLKNLLGDVIKQLIQPYRWIEFKTPSGRLEMSQCDLFSIWAKHGVGVWVLHDEKDYEKLYYPPNWVSFAMRGKLR